MQKVRKHTKILWTHYEQIPCIISNHIVYCNICYRFIIYGIWFSPGREINCSYIAHLANHTQSIPKSYFFAYLFHNWELNKCFQKSKKVTTVLWWKSQWNQSIIIAKSYKNVLGKQASGWLVNCRGSGHSRIWNMHEYSSLYIKYSKCQSGYIALTCAKWFEDFTEKVFQIRPLAGHVWVPKNTSG